MVAKSCGDKEATDIEMTPMIGADDYDGAGNGSNDNLRDPAPFAPKCKRARRNYLAMLGLAYVLTVSSPGTVLWPSCIGQQWTSDAPTTNSSVIGSTSFSHSAEHRNECDWPSISVMVLAKLTCSVIVLILLFLDLQGSDPGMLTSEVIHRLDASKNSNDEPENSNVVPNVDGDASSHNFGDEEAVANSTGDRRCFTEPSSSSRPPPNMHHCQQEQCHPQQKNANRKLYPHTRRKYCHKCRIHPPLRSHHCKINNRCIATFDHHCRFLETCIGERNHFRFWAFVSVNLICLKIALGIVGTGKVDSIWEESSSSLPTQIGQVILILSKLYMHTIFIVVLLLWITHTALALGNITTFELGAGADRVDYLRGTATLDLPFSEGPRRNLRLFFTQDDAFRWTKRRVDASCDRLRKSCGRVHTPIVTNVDDTATVDVWMPTLWKMPEYIERDSEDWWNHPWQNKYWSCC